MEDQEFLAVDESSNLKAVPSTCQICGEGSNITRTRMCVFMPTAHHPQSVMVHEFCGKTAAILPCVNLPHLEILNRAAIRKKFGMDKHVLQALHRSRNATVDADAIHSQEQVYWLTKEVEDCLNEITGIQGLSALAKSQQQKSEQQCVNESQSRHVTATAAAHKEQSVSTQNHRPGFYPNLASPLRHPHLKLTARDPNTSDPTTSNHATSPEIQCIPESSYASADAAAATPLFGFSQLHQAQLASSAFDSSDARSDYATNENQPPPKLPRYSVNTLYSASNEAHLVNINSHASVPLARKPRLSPHDAFMQRLNVVMRRYGTGFGVGYSLVRGVAPASSEVDYAEEDPVKFDPRRCSQAQVEHVRVIIVTPTRQDKMRKMASLVLGEEPHSKMTFSTFFSYQVLDAWYVFCSKYAAIKWWPSRFDLLVGFTDALHRYNHWMLHHPKEWSGKSMVKGLARLWNVLLKKSNAELGIDAEFTRPGVLTLLADFQQQVESIETTSKDATMIFRY